MRSRLGNAVGSSPLLEPNDASACAAHLVGLGQPAVVDVGQRAPAVGRQVARAQRLELGEDVVTAHRARLLEAVVRRVSGSGAATQADER